MFKRILIAILAAQLVIVPAQAKTKCEKGFITETILVMWITYFGLSYLNKLIENNELKKQLEQEKAKQPANNTCLL